MSSEGFVKSSEGEVKGHVSDKCSEEESRF